MTPVFIRGSLETRNFQFDAYGKTKAECLELLKCACHAHSLEYRADFQYFLDLLADEGNVRWSEIVPGRAYRDDVEIVR